MKTCEKSERLRIRGRTEIATYKIPEIPEFNGNPLVEALPPVWDWDTEAAPVIDELTRYFAPDAKIKDAPLTVRQQRLGLFKLQFFQVLDRVRDLEVSVSILIRNGYLSRNPMDPRHRRVLRDRVQAIDSPRPPIISVGNLGLTLLGSPGLGKTRTLERVLQLYPQVILHENYPKDPDFRHTQVAWLYLTCSHDGSTKGLCQQFFQEVDEVIGSDYSTQYEGNENALMAGMATVAGEISLGILGIDEIQFLSAQKSGGKSDLLKFLVQLENTLRIPIVLVGTNRAARLVAATPHQARRSVGTGGRMWLPFKPSDPDWMLITEAMWAHQYVKNPVPFNPTFAKVLFEETQGITAYAVDLFYFTQLDAMNNRTETITVDGLRSASREHESFNRPYVIALKTRDPRLNKLLEDIIPPDFENPVELWRDALNLPPGDLKAATDMSLSGPGAQLVGQPSLTSKQIPPLVQAPPSLPDIGRPALPKRKQNCKTFPPGSIMAICSEGYQNHGKPPYVVLKDQGIVIDITSFLVEVSTAAKC